MSHSLLSPTLSLSLCELCRKPWWRLCVRLLHCKQEASSFVTVLANMMSECVELLAKRYLLWPLTCLTWGLESSFLLLKTLQTSVWVCSKVCFLHVHNTLILARWKNKIICTAVSHSWQTSLLCKYFGGRTHRYLETLNKKSDPFLKQLNAMVVKVLIQPKMLDWEEESTPSQCTDSKPQNLSIINKTVLLQLTLHLPLHLYAA